MWEVLSNMNTMLGAIAIVAGGLVQFAAIVWRISKAEGRIYDRINTVEFDVNLEIQKVRQALLETKLEASNSFIHKDSFQSLAANIDARLIRLEGKLDAVIHK